MAPAQTRIAYSVTFETPELAHSFSASIADPARLLEWEEAMRADQPAFSALTRIEAKVKGALVLGHTPDPLTLEQQDKFQTAFLARFPYYDARGATFSFSVANAACCNQTAVSYEVSSATLAQAGLLRASVNNQQELAMFVESLVKNAPDFPPVNSVWTGHEAYPGQNLFWHDGLWNMATTASVAKCSPPGGGAPHTDCTDGMNAFENARPQTPAAFHVHGSVKSNFMTPPAAKWMLECPDGQTEECPWQVSVLFFLARKVPY
jgi:hypothetical protein